MNEKELHILIERYFDGDTSVTEERRLLDALLSHPPGDREVDEALAVMGFARVVVPAEMTARRLFKRIMTAAAVVLLVISAAGAFFLTTSQSSAPQSECYAYVGGERIEDKNQIESIMKIQMCDMGDAADEVEKQLAEDLGDFKGLFN